MEIKKFNPILKRMTVHKKLNKIWQRNHSIASDRVKSLLRQSKW